MYGIVCTELAILVRINAKMHYFEAESQPPSAPAAPRPVFANPQLFFHNSHTV